CAAPRLALQVRARAAAADANRRVVALRDHLLARRIGRADTDPFDEPLVAGLRRAEIRVVDAAHLKHLEAAAALGRTAARGKVAGPEPIEAGRAVVLREVDETRRRIDADGLVLHAPHLDDRRRGGLAEARRRHLEDVAVTARGAGAPLEHQLLASQPRAPRGRAAGA